MARPRKKWELTEESLNKLLACFHPDREIAGQKLNRLHQKLVTFFESRRCHCPEEYADRTIYRVARKLDEGLEFTTEDPSKYFYTVARYVFMEYWEDMKMDPDPLDDVTSQKHPFIDPRYEDIEEIEKLLIKQEKECLDDCLQKLSDKKRELIIEYYQGEAGAKVKNRKKMAEERGIPQNALRIRVLRIREKLEKCIVKCLGKL
ncbi:MAG: sigma-70 family RNA polymerase sigma factor [Blastocatellia bacterium]